MQLDLTWRRRLWLSTCRSVKQSRDQSARHTVRSNRTALRTSLLLNTDILKYLSKTNLRDQLRAFRVSESFHQDHMALARVNELWGHEYIKPDLWFDEAWCVIMIMRPLRKKHLNTRLSLGNSEILNAILVTKFQFLGYWGSGDEEAEKRFADERYINVFFDIRMVQEKFWLIQCWDDLTLAINRESTDETSSGSQNRGDTWWSTRYITLSDILANRSAYLSSVCFTGRHLLQLPQPLLRVFANPNP